MMKLENTYKKLPEAFYRLAEPSSAISAKLVLFNDNVATDLNLKKQDFDLDELTGLLSGQKLFENSTPIAMAYSGHQFGHFNPHLGDGRAILLGEVISNGKSFDLHLKGSGPTPFSRRGDGYSGLGPAIREYLVSEAMYHLGVPTTRALCVCTTGRTVTRQETQPGASMIRVGLGHIRVGTFEYFLARRDFDNLKILIDYSLNRFASELKDIDDSYFLFFKNIAFKKMSLVAKWNSLGFIHGVMNTDNTSISGETIDYGPCAFMDKYQHDKVFSSIDQHGRYAYDNQGNIALWNLSCLANCFIAVADKPESEVEKYQSFFDELKLFFKTETLKLMGNKLGIFEANDDDEKMINDFLNTMEQQQADFTNTFRELSYNLEKHPDIYRRLKEQNESLDEATELMNNSNPYIIPRNHQIEKAIQLACSGDFSHALKLEKIFKNPYTESDESLEFTYGPTPDKEVKRTFCGT